MIERVVEWFHTGGRVVVPSSKNHLRSRRDLHSAFWSHGAGNIDLPPWWVLFLQNRDFSQARCSSRRHRTPKAALSSGLREIFLDFLYPVQTLALIERLNRSTNAHIHAAQNVKQRSRSYTSIAASFLKGAKAFGTASGASDRKSSTSSSSQTPQVSDPVRRRINEILDLEDPTSTYDELWQSYQALLQMSRSLSPEELIKMLQRLGTSIRTIDNERAVALFDSIPVQERRAVHYSYPVRAALSLKDLDTAIDIHRGGLREGFGRVGGSIGTAELLRYTVEHQRWELAIDAWYPFWVDRLPYYTRPDIWTGVNSLSLPDLIEKAISAADFAISITESSQLENAVAARDFAVELIRQTFGIKNTNFDIQQHWRLLQKARVLDAFDMKIQNMALQQLMSVDTREHGHRALFLYRSLRKEPTFLPSRVLLDSVKNKMLEIRSSPGMVMVIEDYRTYLQELPARTALELAKGFADLGQLESVQKLFHDVCSTYGKPQNAWFQVLLFVHNRRADLKGVVDAFHDLQKDFQFEPTVKAYNYVIGAFSRIGDVDGALTWFNKLLESERRPDSQTYCLLMLMYAKRGDWEAVHDFYQQAKIEGIKTSVRMFDALVLANINGERLHEAEQFVKEASLVDLEGSRTFMWTILLNAYALRKEIEKVSALHKQMRDSGVASDGMTYAALMTSLAIAKFPEAAKQIMDIVMPRANIRSTSLHYAIVMGAYLATNRFPEVFNLYKRMLSRNLKPTMSTQNIVLRAAASVDKLQHLKVNQDLDQDGQNQPELVRAQQVFEQTLSGLDPMELAPSEPRKFVGPNPLNEAFYSTYFEYLIFLYGKDAAYTKVTELYESYISTSSRFTDRDVEASPPIRLLSSLMVAHLRAGNHEEVERCWYLALEKSKQLACRAKAVTTEPGWVLPSRRLIMNLPLRSYIFSLSQQGRNDDLISTIRSLDSSGFTLNNPNWNHYIQHLAQSPEPQHQLLAFQLCERELISNWPGWDVFGNPQYIKHKIRRMTDSALRLPGRQASPAYLTLVHLAAVYLQAKQGTRLIKLQRLADEAPKTVDAIINMPSMADKHQITLLRGG